MCETDLIVRPLPILAHGTFQCLPAPAPLSIYLVPGTRGLWEGSVSSIFMQNVWLSMSIHSWHVANCAAASMLACTTWYLSDRSLFCSLDLGPYSIVPGYVFKGISTSCKNLNCKWKPIAWKIILLLFSQTLKSGISTGDLFFIG